MIPYGDTEKNRIPPWVNYTLIVINIAIFVYLHFFCPEPVPLIKKYGFISVRFWEGGWTLTSVLQKIVPLITANFLHADILHILGNMLFLLIFGDNIEDKVGHGRYLLFYLVCGIISMLVFGYNHKDSWQAVIGASGAISGIMGAFYIISPRVKIKSWFIFFTRDISALYYLGVWFLFQLTRGILTLEGFPWEPVAWWAHIGGFIAGALLINLFVIGTPQVEVRVKAKKT